jgi:murein DD-endopeptidase MepM/ murein hydrolase activator NlpD
VDFAVTEETSSIALGGHPVQAVVPGKVAAAIRDRFPYGNAVLIETPLEELPSGWLDEGGFPTLAPTLQPLPALTCPTAQPLDWDFTTRSLYTLYAHLQEPPALERGETVACGQALGAIGASGNALNPHLHLETRLGPSGARFESLAHYDASASPEEMENYCTWRVRGVFQMFDPMRLLAELP